MKPSNFRFWHTMLLAVLILLPFNNFAQSLEFGTEITSSGDLSNRSTSFTISPDGSYIYFYVTIPYSYGYDTDIEYRIFKVDDYGKEIYETTIEQTIEDNWINFWKQINFYKPGRYRVYVYNVDYDGDEYITSADVKISYR